MSQKALVVDNDFFFVEFLTELLELRDFEVTKASDGKEAISKFEAASFDLITTDIIMPKIDGKQFIQYIRKRNPDLDTPILAVSGIIMEKMDGISDIGADYYLVKGPMEQMKQSVNQVLDKLEDRPLPAPSDEIVFKPDEMFPRFYTTELLDTVSFHEGITQSVGVGILVLDKDARILNANPAALDLLSRPIEEVMNRQVVALFPNEDRPTIIGALKKVVQFQELGKAAISVVPHESEIRVVVTLLKIDGKIAGWVMAMEDLDQWEEQA